MARDGATIGYVGVPHLVEGVDLGLLFGRNIGIAGGVTPARAYIPELLKDVALGDLDASAVFDADVDLDGRAGRLRRDGQPQGGQGPRQRQLRRAADPHGAQ